MNVYILVQICVCGLIMFFFSFVKLLWGKKRMTGSDRFQAEALNG